MNFLFKKNLFGTDIPFERNVSVLNSLHELFQLNVLFAHVEQVFWKLGIHGVDKRVDERVDRLEAATEFTLDH